MTRWISIGVIIYGILVGLGANGGTLTIQNWLMHPPLDVTVPAFQATPENPRGTLLEQAMIDVAQWQPMLEGKKGQVEYQLKQTTGDTLWLTASGRGMQMIYLRTYVQTPVYQKLTLEVATNSPLQVFWDGTAVKKLTTTNEWQNQSLSVVGEPGIHAITLQTIVDGDGPVGLVVRLTGVDTTTTVTLHPQKTMSISLLLDTPEVWNIALDPTGQHVLVGIRQVDPESGKYRVRYELYRVKDGQRLQVFPAHVGMSDVQWAPDGQRFTFIKKEENGKASLFLVNLATGKTVPVLEKVKGLTSHYWHPQANKIYFVSETKLKKNDLAYHLQTPRDRWPWFRNTKTFYEYDLTTRVQRQITAGILGAEFKALSSDGKYLYLTIEDDDFQHRPYVTDHLVQIDLITLQADTLLTSGWLNRVIPSPDGKQLLLLGGPSLFGKLGWNLPEGMIPNEFDTQAYLFNLNTRQARSISREFNPDIVQGFWTANGKTIYFQAIQGEYIKLFEYNLSRKTFREIPTALDVIREIQWDRQGKVAVYWGSSVTTPSRVYVLRKKRSRLLVNPAADAFRQVTFGKVEKWDFKNADGITIEGRVYYPPNFDPNRKYPCIVYYYGGVNTTVRDFGGRYPKNLFAAHGYVVYVLQPSGATGYGQEFSAWHVNDWGKRVSQEIIEGTRQFLKAHPFVDANRVGAIGASYGGFMTMLLLTKTDIFATGIAHAGISSISSYWGEGFWGYIYSAYSAAGSFPWNRRDVFIDQSPLFHADKVTRPLLLLHGIADSNVPKGESEQFWVALKLLGKEVEYVAIPGQDHHILDYKKRIQWQKTILAWFDRWLKGQPEWWNALYPPLTNPPAK